MISRFFHYNGMDAKKRFSSVCFTHIDQDGIAVLQGFDYQKRRIVMRSLYIQDGDICLQNGDALYSFVGFRVVGISKF